MAGRTRALVITDPAMLVRHANGRLVVTRDGEKVAAIPIEDLAHVALHGPVTMTGAALARLLDAGVDLALHTASGRLRGQLQSAEPKNVFLLLAQVAAWQSADRRAAFARALVASKIAGQRQLLVRHALDHGSAGCKAAATELARLESRAWDAPDVPVAMGIEGAAAAAYFGAFPELLRGGWTFPGRVRRPATDPVNALLSFGYALASSELARHLLAAGFDLRVGLVHGVRYGRRSLVLDLVEELRAPLADRFALRLLNRGQLAPTDFEPGEGRAVRLTSDGRRRYLTLWEETLDAPGPRLRREPPLVGEAAVRVPGLPEDPRGPSWRARMRSQVARLRRFLLRGEAYVPLTTTLEPPDRSRRDPAAEEPPEIPEESEDD